MQSSRKNILLTLLILAVLPINSYGTEVELRYNKVMHGGHPLVEQDCPTRNGSKTIQQWVEEKNAEKDLSPVSKINLRDNEIGDKGAAIIVELILQHVPHLKALDLSYNPISEKGGTVFVPLLLSPSFEHLILVDTDAGSLDGRKAIRTALEHKLSETPSAQASAGEGIEILIDRLCSKIIYIPKGSLDFFKQSTPADEIRYHENYYGNLR